MKRMIIILLAATILLPCSFAGQANRNIISDNWNTAACGFTKMAILKLDYSYHVDRIEIWYKWRAGESGVPYKVSFAGRELRRGTLVRDTCDKYQNTWCVATDSLDLDLGPGSYTFRLANARVCQNAGSGGMGFIRAIGFDSTPNKVVPSNTKGVPTNRSGRIIAHIWKASSQTSPFAEDIPVPGYAISYSYRGLTRLNLKDNRGAVNDLDHFLATNANDSSAHNNRGLAKERLGDNEGALADYEQAIALDPKNETVRKNLAQLQEAIAATQMGTSTNTPVKPDGSKSSGWVTAGPAGAAVYALAIDPQSPATVYAGTLRGGVFKSSNAGASWSAVNAGLTNLSVRALAINPQSPTTLYAATNGSGVFKSSNGGASWSAANPGLTTATVLSLVIDPQNPTTLYAGMYNVGGIWKTTNGGASWNPVNNGLTNSYVPALAVDPQNPTTLYAGTWGGGVFKSSNGGASWSAINAGLTTATVLSLAVDPQSARTVYAGTTGGVFKSSNGGASWSAVNAGLTNIDNGVAVLAIDLQSPMRVYAGTDGGGAGVYRSANGGSSWSALNSGLTNTSVQALAIDPQSPTTLYAGTNDGIFKLAGGSIPPEGAALIVSVSPAQQTVNSGEKLTTTAKPVGGTPPYRYEWFDGSNRSSVTSASITWIPRNPGPNTLKVIVTDAAGNKAEAQCNAQVSAPTDLPASSGGVNLALHKPASQSSVYDNNQDYGPQVGVDGVQSDQYATGFFHTNLEDAPWWQVDLQGTYQLKEIRLFNRTQSNPERANHIQVKLSINGRDWEAVYNHNGTTWNRLSINVASKSARFVRVQLAEKNYLHLNEVEVYGAGGSQPNPQPPAGPLSVKVITSKQTVSPEEVFKTTAEVTGGVSPYQYKWFSNNSPAQTTTQSVNWTPHDAGNRIIRVEVTDAAGNKAEASCTAQVVSTEPSPSKSVRYHMTANGYHFDVILTMNGSTFTGKDSSGEQITNGIISGDAVSFHRTAACCSQGQEYKGKIQGNKMVGTFTGAGGAPGQTWPWEIDLTPVPDDQPKPATLSVSVSPAQQTVNAGEQVTTAANAAGGTPPYQYEWSENGTGVQSKDNSVRWTMGANPGTRIIKVVVTDAAGQKAEAQSNIVVQGITPPANNVLTGKVTSGPRSLGIPRVTVIIGALSCQDGPGGNDTVFVAPNYVEAATDASGNFTATVPSLGLFGVLAWKEGYVWDLQQEMRAPGHIEFNLSPSLEVGRHLHLQRANGSDTLRVVVSPTQQTITVGGKVTTKANVTGGRPPYQYEWFNNDTRNETKGDSVQWTMGANPGIRIIKVVVTDLAGHKAESQSSIIIQAEPLPPPPPNVINGKITTGPKSSGLPFVTVIIGALECSKGPGGVDTVTIKPDAITVSTDQSGSFTAKVPGPGMYGVLAWKEGYAWDLQDVVVPAPTSINLSLSAEVGYHTKLQRAISGADKPSLANRLLSLNRPAKMSPDGAPAPGGNDGTKNGAFGFKTQFDTHPWWQVDLGTDCIISEVRIYNSKTYQPEDAKYLEIRFSSDENSWVTRYQHDGSIPPYPLVIPFFNTIGRYVRIVLRDSNISLHLDEVEVYGHPAAGPQPLSGGGAIVPLVTAADLRIVPAVPRARDGQIGDKVIMDQPTIALDVPSKTSKEQHEALLKAQEKSIKIAMDGSNLWNKKLRNSKLGTLPNFAFSDRLGSHNLNREKGKHSQFPIILFCFGSHEADARVQNL